MNTVVPPTPPAMSRYVAEALGTFFLMIAGTGAIIVNAVSDGAVTHPGISLVFGLVVMALIYALGDISGCHINPAVTVAFWVARRFPGRDVMPYIVSQLIGAFAASILLWTMFEHPNLGATIPRTGYVWQSFVFELICTNLLMFVVLNVSTGAKEKGIMAGAAVGSVIAFEALFAGPISGASMNPARSIAPAIVSGQTQHLWIYIVATTLGAVLAVAFCRLMGCGKCEG